MARILLIEPDRVLAEIYGEMLRQAGYDTSYSPDAQMAIHSIDDATPDIIVLELQLARHNGVEFLYELRSYPEWESIPVIVLSMLPELQVKDSLRQLGIAAYHYKPQTNLKNLLGTVKRLTSSAVV